MATATAMPLESLAKWRGEQPDSGKTWGGRLHSIWENLVIMGRVAVGDGWEFSLRLVV